MAQLVRAPPCHGGGQGFEPLSGRLLNNFQLQLNIWGLSSAGRASALQAEGHRFEPYRPHLNGWIPEWPKGTDCKICCNLLRWFESTSIHWFLEKRQHSIISRGGAVWKLVGLITRRSFGSKSGPPATSNKSTDNVGYFFFTQKELQKNLFAGIIGQ